VKCHITGMAANDGVWMGGTVVEKVLDLLGSSFGALGLGGGNGADCNVVDCRSIVEESSNEAW
jgi:hypothetical protein